ncbi:GTP-binding protein [Thermoactinospora rubra]|uniref:GTP-binding protein n=1 Tax=Thermoactinospora rubra TaxID=1088767 RepID=UPI000A103634|nr:hypothetical protein [Thermoactinospora rubra]
MDRWRLPVAITVVIAGGGGAGKTTLVRAVSGARPLRTEEPSPGGDGWTSVPVDVGRLTIGDQYTVYLLDTPGPVWDQVAGGATGALVVADGRRPEGCRPAVEYFTARHTPFVVAVNCFEGARRPAEEEVRQALGLAAGVPVMACDARRRASGTQVLIALLEHALARAATPA